MSFRLRKTVEIFEHKLRFMFPSLIVYMCGFNIKTRDPLIGFENALHCNFANGDKWIDLTNRFACRRLIPTYSHRR